KPTAVFVMIREMTSMITASARKTPSAPKRVLTKSLSEESRSMAKRTHPPAATATRSAWVNDTVHTTAAVRISSWENPLLHPEHAGTVMACTFPGSGFGSRHLGGVWSHVSAGPPQYTQANEPNSGNDGSHLRGSIPNSLLKRRLEV